MRRLVDMLLSDAYSILRLLLVVVSTGHGLIIVDKDPPVTYQQRIATIYAGGTQTSTSPFTRGRRRWTLFPVEKHGTFTSKTFKNSNLISWPCVTPAESPTYYTENWRQASRMDRMLTHTLHTFDFAVGRPNHSLVGDVCQLYEYVDQRNKWHWLGIKLAN